MRSDGWSLTARARSGSRMGRTRSRLSLCRSSHFTAVAGMWRPVSVTNSGMCPPAQLITTPRSTDKHAPAPAPAPPWPPTPFWPPTDDTLMHAGHAIALGLDMHDALYLPPNRHASLTIGGYSSQPLAPVSGAVSIVDARSMLTEMYLCHACSCQEILRMNTPPQAAAGPSSGATLYLPTVS
jgi:hypothetical protein